MSGSTERRPHLCSLLCAVLFFGAGCADDSAEFGDARDDDARAATPDVGPDAPDLDPMCTLAVGRLCYDSFEFRCAEVAQWVADGRCTDEDRDCFVGTCRSGLEAEAAVLADCDDLDPDVYPGAPETCTAVDHDCDGTASEGVLYAQYPDEDDEPGIELGGSCVACGREGKVECAIDDPYRAACSVMAGQSDAPVPLPDELCDGVDDDCDGAIDEGCRLPTLPGARIETPALCPDGTVAVVEDGALVLIEPTSDRPERSTLRPAEAGATLPACGPAGLAWLERRDEAPCIAAENRPLACPSRLWFLAPGGSPVRVTPQPGAFGRPAVGAASVWWHSVLEGLPGLLTWAPDDGEPLMSIDGDYSDPTAPDADGWIAVRAWQADAARVIQLDPENGSQRTANGAPGGQRDPGPPTRDGRWMAWSGGGEPPVLWVVAGAGDDGFRPVAGPGPQVAPRLAGQIIVWLDAATGALRTFDLRTGDERVLTDGPIAADGFAVRRGEAVWIEMGEEGDRLVRGALPDAPDPEPAPDMGPPEPDMGPPEPDMGPPEPDMGPPELDMDPPAPDMTP